MSENLLSGILLTVLAGVLQGSFMVPLKYTRKWSWENAWVLSSASSYLIFPWLFALVTVPRLGDVLSHTSVRTVSHTLLFGLGWGIGALTFGLGVNYLGMAVGIAVILGLTASIGSLVPLLVLSPEKLGSPEGELILSGVTVLVLGISLCSWAGKLKEKALGGHVEPLTGNQDGSFALGLLFCILSGILSSCGNFGFAFGSEISAWAIKYGTPQNYAAYPLWAVITLPLFVCNVGYCLYLLVRNRTLGRFLYRDTRHYYLGTLGMGMLWMGGMALYGTGANKLGRLGSSIGWAVLMSSIVIVANLWGLLTGEWEGSGRKPLLVMYAGMMVLLAAIVIIGLSNTF
jgi:L-rhamnose-H+ transport protein